MHLRFFSAFFPFLLHLCFFPALFPFLYTYVFFSCISLFPPIYRECMHVHPSALQFVHYFPYSSALMSFSLHFFLLFPIFMDFLFSLVPPHSPMRCFSGIAASTAAPVSLARALPAMTMLALRTNPAKSGKASWDASIKVRKNGGKGDFRGKAGLGMTRGLTGEKREEEVEGTESCLWH